MNEFPDGTKLYSEGPGQYCDLSWLEESYVRPESFWNGLFRQTGGTGRPRTTVPFGEYDFYNDIIVCNIDNPAPALRWYDAASGWQKISYGELGKRVDELAWAWRLAGVERGSTLCLVHPMGVELMIALVAALRNGLVLSLLPPLGETFLRNRLASLGPDHIDADPSAFHLLNLWEEIILKRTTLTATEPGNERPCTYVTGEIVALCFDPAAEEPLLPAAVTGDVAYLCPLRDGVVALGLHRCSAAAYPGSDFMETQPWLLLASLLTGGTFVHMDMAAIEGDPGLLSAHPVRTLGISARLRNILMENPVDASHLCEQWFKDPATSSGGNPAGQGANEGLGREAEKREGEAIMSGWQIFADRVNLSKSYSANLKWRASLGGCELFSVWQRGGVHANVLPSAGFSWQLEVPEDPSEGATYECGFPHFLGMGEALPLDLLSACFLGACENGWVYGGSSAAGREGRTYPAGELLDLLSGKHILFSVVFLPRAEVAGRFFIVLLAFSGLDRQVGGVSFEADVRQKIHREMGAAYLPDRIYLFPLLPPLLEEGGVDHAWCKERFISGDLAGKARDELYRSISRLRHLLRK